MDPSRFDALSRRFAAPGNRRSFLKVVAGLFAGAAVTTIPADGADAVACKASLLSCTKGSQCCSGTCTDAKHPDRTRRSRCACGTGTVFCNGSCHDIDHDPANCGGCGVVCPATSADACLGAATCVNGACGFALRSDGTACSDTDSCTVGDICRAGTCVAGPVLGCNELPHADGLCINGSCAVAACDEGYADCNGVAADGCEVNVLTDTTHCGACGVSCDGGEVCVGGSCTPNTCDALCFGDFCVDGEAGPACFGPAGVKSDCNDQCVSQADCTGGGICSSGFHYQGTYYDHECGVTKICQRAFDV